MRVHTIKDEFSAIEDCRKALQGLDYHGADRVLEFVKNMLGSGTLFVDTKVRLIRFPEEKKIYVIKYIREYTNVSLADANAFVQDFYHNGPETITSNNPIDLYKHLQAIGADVELILVEPTQKIPPQLPI